MTIALLLLIFGLLLIASSGYAVVYSAKLLNTRKNNFWLCLGCIVITVVLSQIIYWLAGEKGQTTLDDSLLFNLFLILLQSAVFMQLLETSFTRAIGVTLLSGLISLLFIGIIAIAAYAIIPQKDLNDLLSSITSIPLSSVEKDIAESDDLENPDNFDTQPKSSVEDEEFD